MLYSESKTKQSFKMHIMMRKEEIWVFVQGYRYAYTHRAKEQGR
jgi:hypothetical protein